MSATRVLLVTGGHPFDREAFLAVFDDDRFENVEITHVEHPDALAVLTAEGTAGHDVLVMYDMPGIEFTRGDPPARFLIPPPEFVDGYAGLLEAGRGMVFLHHAIASWPAWPEFAPIVGGRFHYQPGELGGREWPDSGYRFDVTHTVEVLDPEHPLAAGLPGIFERVKHAANSPVAYVQFGDGPGTYADPLYRQTVANAVSWAASPAAHEWARSRNAGSD